MMKEVVTLTLRWPNKSNGLDVSQITDCVNDFFKSYKRHYVYDCGSGRMLKIERKQESSR